MGDPIPSQKAQRPRSRRSGVPEPKTVGPGPRPPTSSQNAAAHPNISALQAETLAAMALKANEVQVILGQARDALIAKENEIERMRHKFKVHVEHNNEIRATLFSEILQLKENIHQMTKDQPASSSSPLLKNSSSSSASSSFVYQPYLASKVQPPKETIAFEHIAAIADQDAVMAASFRPGLDPPSLFFPPFSNVEAIVRDLESVLASGKDEKKLKQLRMQFEFKTKKMLEDHKKDLSSKDTEIEQLKESLKLMMDELSATRLRHSSSINLKAGGVYGDYSSASSPEMSIMALELDQAREEGTTAMKDLRDLRQQVIRLKKQALNARRGEKIARKSLQRFATGIQEELLRESDDEGDRDDSPVRKEEVDEENDDSESSTSESSVEESIDEENGEENGEETKTSRRKLANMFLADFKSQFKAARRASKDVKVERSKAAARLKELQDQLFAERDQAHDIAEQARKLEHDVQFYKNRSEYLDKKVKQMESEVPAPSRRRSVSPGDPSAASYSSSSPRRSASPFDVADQVKSPLPRGRVPDIGLSPPPRDSSSSPQLPSSSPSSSLFEAPRSPTASASVSDPLPVTPPPPPYQEPKPRPVEEMTALERMLNETKVVQTKPMPDLDRIRSQKEKDLQAELDSMVGKYNGLVNVIENFREVYNEEKQRFAERLKKSEEHFEEERKKMDGKFNKEEVRIQKKHDAELRIVRLGFDRERKRLQREINGLKQVMEQKNPLLSLTMLQEMQQMQAAQEQQLKHSSDEAQFAEILARNDASIESSKNSSPRSGIMHTASMKLSETDIAAAAAAAGLDPSDLQLAYESERVTKDSIIASVHTIVAAAQPHHSLLDALVVKDPSMIKAPVAPEPPKKMTLDELYQSYQMPGDDDDEEEDEDSDEEEVQIVDENGIDSDGAAQREKKKKKKRKQSKGRMAMKGGAFVPAGSVVFSPDGTVFALPSRSDDSNNSHNHEVECVTLPSDLIGNVVPLVAAASAAACAFVDTAQQQELGHPDSAKKALNSWYSLLNRKAVSVAKDFSHKMTRDASIMKILNNASTGQVEDVAVGPDAPFTAHEKESQTDICLADTLDVTKYKPEPKPQVPPASLGKMLLGKKKFAAAAKTALLGAKLGKAVAGKKEPVVAAEVGHGPKNMEVADDDSKKNKKPKQKKQKKQKREKKHQEKKDDDEQVVEKHGMQVHFSSNGDDDDGEDQLDENIVSSDEEKEANGEQHVDEEESDAEDDGDDAQSEADEEAEELLPEEDTLDEEYEFKLCLERVAEIDLEKAIELLSSKLGSTSHLTNKLAKQLQQLEHSHSHHEASSSSVDDMISSHQSETRHHAPASTSPQGAGKAAAKAAKARAPSPPPKVGVHPVIADLLRGQQFQLQLLQHQLMSILSSKGGSLPSLVRDNSSLLNALSQEDPLPYSSSFIVNNQPAPPRKLAKRGSYLSYSTRKKASPGLSPTHHRRSHGTKFASVKTSTYDHDDDRFDDDEEGPPAPPAQSNDNNGSGLVGDQMNPKPMPPNAPYQQTQLLSSQKQQQIQSSQNPPQVSSFVFPHSSSVAAASASFSDPSQLYSSIQHQASTMVVPKDNGRMAAAAAAAFGKHRHRSMSPGLRNVISPKSRSRKLLSRRNARRQVASRMRSRSNARSNFVNFVSDQVVKQKPRKKYEDEGFSDSFEDESEEEGGAVSNTFSRFVRHRRKNGILPAHSTNDFASVYTRPSPSRSGRVLMSRAASRRRRQRMDMYLRYGTAGAPLGSRSRSRSRSPSPFTKKKNRGDGVAFLVSDSEEVDHFSDEDEEDKDWQDIQQVFAKHLSSHQQERQNRERSRRSRSRSRSRGRSGGRTVSRSRSRSRAHSRSQSRGHSRTQSRSRSRGGMAGMNVHGQAMSSQSHIPVPVLQKEESEPQRQHQQPPRVSVSVSPQPPHVRQHSTTPPKNHSHHHHHQQQHHHHQQHSSSISSISPSALVKRHHVSAPSSPMFEGSNTTPLRSRSAAAPLEPLSQPQLHSRNPSSPTLSPNHRLPSLQQQSRVSPAPGASVTIPVPSPSSPSGSASRSTFSQAMEARAASGTLRGWTSGPSRPVGSIAPSSPFMSLPSFVDHEMGGSRLPAPQKGAAPVATATVLAGRNGLMNPPNRSPASNQAPPASHSKSILPNIPPSQQQKAAVAGQPPAPPPVRLARKL